MTLRGGSNTFNEEAPSSAQEQDVTPPKRARPLPSAAFAALETATTGRSARAADAAERCAACGAEKRGAVFGCGHFVECAACCASATACPLCAPATPPG